MLILLHVELEDIEILLITTIRCEIAKLKPLHIKSHDLIQKYYHNRCIFSPSRVLYNMIVRRFFFLSRGAFTPPRFTHLRHARIPPNLHLVQKSPNPLWNFCSAGDRFPRFQFARETKFNSLSFFSFFLTICILDHFRFPLLFFRRASQSETLPLVWLPPEIKAVPPRVQFWTWAVIKDMRREERGKA